jgi:hypothetical protein
VFVPTGSASRASSGATAPKLKPNTTKKKSTEVRITQTLYCATGP